MVGGPVVAQDRVILDLHNKVIRVGRVRVLVMPQQAAEAVPERQETQLPVPRAALVVTDILGRILETHTQEVVVVAPAVLEQILLLQVVQAVADMVTGHRVQQVQTVKLEHPV